VSLLACPSPTPIMSQHSRNSACSRETSSAYCSARSWRLSSSSPSSSITSAGLPDPATAATAAASASAAAAAPAAAAGDAAAPLAGDCEGVPPAPAAAVAAVAGVSHRAYCERISSGQSLRRAGRVTPLGRVGDSWLFGRLGGHVIVISYGRSRGRRGLSWQDTTQQRVSSDRLAKIAPPTCTM
jgi:hypothetical protein